MTEELSKPTIVFNLNKIHRSLIQARNSAQVWTIETK